MVKGYLEESNAYNSALQKALQADGRIFISSTSVDGVFYLRIAVLSFRTHKSTVDVLLEMIDGVVAVVG
jgi:aromatic-L-amino-acid decarboxylase